MENLEQHLRRVHPKDGHNVGRILDDGDRSRINASKTARRSTRFSTGARRALISGSIVVVVLAAAYFVMASRPRPQIQTDHSYYDLGIVPQIKTSHTFSFTNGGGGDLSVKRIWTSCGCTTAKLVLNGIESPEFGMPGHGGYSGPWEAKLRPGETADLIVYYDAPIMSDIFVGERYVYIDTDDPAQPEFQFTIAVQEVP